MMNSMFESFDPMMSLMNLNILIIWWPVTLSMLILFYKKMSRQNMLTKTMNKHMFTELSASLNNKNSKVNMLILISLFMMLISYNCLGMMPYIYTITSQMTMTLSLALPVWISYMLFGTLKNTNKFLSHLVPNSTPMALSQTMVLIESISQIIRPLTLSIRLCANMTAGHILMALSSYSISMFNTMSVPLLILIVLEIAVAFIQSYVFSMLLSMYLSENT